ncbi:MAG: abortive infection system antitoxin AbiGi family protein, partial [Pseudomonadota bacterium]
MSLQRYVSDELTHFVGRGLSHLDQAEEQQYALLVEILRGGVLGTDKSTEVTYSKDKRFSANEFYKANLVCFSDIPVPDLGIHMGKFSRFGLAFRKCDLIARGANPVFYVATNANPGPAAGSPGHSRAEHFDREHERIWELFHGLERLPGLDEEKIRDMWNFLVYSFFSLVKFYCEGLPAADPENYYMEREWRIFGSLEFSLDQVRRV